MRLGKQENLFGAAVLVLVFGAALQTPVMAKNKKQSESSELDSSSIEDYPIYSGGAHGRCFASLGRG